MHPAPEGVTCKAILNVRTKEKCKGNLLYHPHYLDQIHDTKIVRLTHLCDNPDCYRYYLCRCGEEFGSHVSIVELTLEEKEYQERLKK